jgi:hypothetical protein
LEGYEAKKGRTGVMDEYLVGYRKEKSRDSRGPKFVTKEISAFSPSLGSCVGHSHLQFLP